MKKILFVLLILSSSFCNSNKDENTAKLTFPEVMALLGPADSVAYFYTRDIDKTLTTNCGIASPGVTATPGAPGGTAPPTTGTTGSSNSKFTILSQIFFKTGEALTLKFPYDTNQLQGAIDAQQGFTLTGGIFGHTVTGRQGNVKWNSQGLGYITESGTGAQTLSFMIIELNLKGTFTQGVSGSGTTPVECNTSDGINCTSSVTTTKCFTQDFVKCVTQSTGTSNLTITGKINCNANNVIPQ